MYVKVLFEYYLSEREADRQTLAGYMAELELGTSQV
jgi:hypothetical protein